MLIVDLLAEEAFHLADDDAFLVQAYQPAAESVALVSSPSSVAAVQRMRLANVSLHRTRFHGGFWQRLPARLVYWLRALTAPRGSSGQLVLLQSFEVSSALMLAALLRGRSVVPIFTNHIAAIEERPVKRFGLGLLLRSSAAVVVYSRYERGLLNRLFPSVGSRVVQMRFHKPGARRRVAPTAARQPLLSYIGWARDDKGIDQMLAAVRAYRGPLRFGLFGKHGLSSTEVDALERLGVEVVSGYLPEDQYEETFLRSLAVVLPYARSYQGKLSGIFCDAIATGTPVVAPAIEPFVEFFERYGELGLLVDFERSDWWSGLDQLLDARRHQAMQDALGRAREDHAFDVVAADFQELLGRGS